MREDKYAKEVQLDGLQAATAVTGRQHRLLDQGGATGIGAACPRATVTSAEIVFENDTIAGLAGTEVVEGFVDLREGKMFGNRGDAVAGAEI